jgi:hypothetical protein
MSEHIALAFELLDRQIIDRNGYWCGKVEDLRFTDPAEGEDPVLTHLLTGFGSFTHRFHGGIGRRMRRIWRRLHTEKDPAPLEIALGAISRIDYEVHLSITAEEAGLTQTEEWARRYITKIPGAR